MLRWYFSMYGLCCQIPNNWRINRLYWLVPKYIAIGHIDVSLLESWLLTTNFLKVAIFRSVGKPFIKFWIVHRLQRFGEQITFSVVSTFVITLASGIWWRVESYTPTDIIQSTISVFCQLHFPWSCISWLSSYRFTVDQPGDNVVRDYAWILL